MIGPSVNGGIGFASCDEWNRAYEVTDCGLVVGQLAVSSASPGQDPCFPVTRHAFIYSSVPRPDLGLSSELRLLENPVELGAVAFDANDHGYIVGAAGGDTPRLVDWEFSERAVMWRVQPAAGGAVVTATVVNPPPDQTPTVPPFQYFLPYGDPDYGYGRLTSVQAGDEPYAAGTFRLRLGCFEQQVSTTRTAAVAVRFGGDGSLNYRFSRAAQQFDANNEYATTEERAEAIADNVLLLGGFRESACDISGGVCDGTALHATAVWTPESVPPWLERELRTPDPFDWNPFPDASTPFDSVAPIQAIKDDGTAAGWVSDHVPDAGGGLYPCERHAAAWAPGSGSLVKLLGGFHAPECALRHEFFASVAADLDRVVIRPEDADGAPGSGQESGALSGVLVVGSGLRDVDPVAPVGQPREGRRFGALWFRPDVDSDQAWTSDWTYREVTDMVSPASPLAEPPPNSRFRVSWINGVNVHGDMAGQLLVEQQVNGVTETTYFPILLRAVKVSGVGDFNRDGTVDSSDLAVVLSAWCNALPGVNCSATADINLDGSVDSADLGMVLSRWGAQSNPPTCQLGLVGAPPAIAEDSKRAVDFSIQYVGLEDIEVYREWSAAVPEVLRDLVDGAIFDLSKDMLETEANEGGAE